MKDNSAEQHTLRRTTLLCIYHASLALETQILYKKKLENNLVVIIIIINNIMAQQAQQHILSGNMLRAAEKQNKTCLRKLVNRKLIQNGNKGHIREN